MKATLKLVALLVAVGAAAGGWYAWRSGGGDAESRYRLAKVTRGPIAAVVAASGTLNAVSTVQVRSQTAGQVKEIHADFNTPVAAGQVIARIDPTAYELRVGQTRADLEAAEGALAAARAELADAPAQGARRKIRQAIQAALAAAQRRELLLQQAQAELERTAIRAPVDGTVILRNVDAGQTVTAGPQAPVLFSIARDLREMQVEAAIGAADAARLRVGMPVGFTVEAYPRRSFSGELRQIRKSLQNGQSAASYTVIISAHNPDRALLPGMAATVRIVVEERANALKVPNAALRWRPADAENAPRSPERRERRAQVHVLEDGRPRPVALRLGLDDGSSTEILGNTLAEGAQVVVGVTASERATSPADSR